MKNLYLVAPDKADVFKNQLFRKNSLKNSYIVNGTLAIISEMAQK